MKVEFALILRISEMMGDMELYRGLTVVAWRRDESKTCPNLKLAQIRLQEAGIMI